MIELQRELLIPKAALRFPNSSFYDLLDRNSVNVSKQSSSPYLLLVFQRFNFLSSELEANMATSSQLDWIRSKAELASEVRLFSFYTDLGGVDFLYRIPGVHSCI